MLFKLNNDSEPCHMTSSSNVSVIFYTSEAYERDPVSKNKVDLIWKFAQKYYDCIMPLSLKGFKSIEDDISDKDIWR